MQIEKHAGAAEQTRQGPDLRWDVSAGHLWQKTASILTLTEWERRLFWFALVCSIVARFSGLLPGYSNDDYQGTIAPETLDIPILSQGRDVQYWLWSGLRTMGAGMPSASVLGWVFLTVTLIAVGLILCRQWHITGSPVASGAAILLIVLHPYQSEIFSFRQTTWFLALALILGFAAYALAPLGRYGWTLAVMLFTSSLLTYQVSLNFLLMAVVVSVVFILDQGHSDQVRFWRSTVRQISMIAASILLSILLSHAFASLEHVPLISRAQIIPVSLLGTRFPLALRQLHLMFFEGEPVLALYTKCLITASALLGFAGLIVSGRRRLAFLSLSVFLLATPLCIGLTLVSTEWWPVPRTSSQTAIFWGALSAFLISRTSPKAAGLQTALIGLTLLMFIGNDDRILLDQVRLNKRDAAKANRIVMRLEQLPNFDHLLGVYMTRGRWYYQSPISSTEGDLNSSALLPPWSSINLLNETSGYRFVSAPAPVQVRAEEYCNKSAAWPAQEAVTSLDGYGVVCLEK